MKKSLALLFVCLILSGCFKAGKYVKTEQIIIDQQETNKGTETTVNKVARRAAKDVIEKSTSVKSVTRITDLKGNKLPGRLDISPEGDKILVELYENSKDAGYLSNIWTLKTDGTGLTKVTQGKYLDLDPIYSPDSKFIFFSSNRGEIRPKIWRVFASGVGGLTRVTSSNTSDRRPSVSPSGQEIAYQALLPGTDEWQIWAVNTNGALPTQLLTGITPAFSRDGKKVLYSSLNTDTKKNDIWMMNSDGTSRTQLTTGDADYFTPHWSPDGSKIVYSSDKGLDEEREKNFDVWMMNSDGTNTTQLTTNGSQDDLPVFDPKGKYVYFRSNRGGTWDIWRMELL
jgi:TolB protein